MDENTPQPQWGTQLQEPETQPQNPRVAPELPTVRWSASEFISHGKGSMWYLKFGVASAFLTFLVVYVSGEILPGLVVALACVTLAVYSARQPETKQYEINDYGITVSGRFMPYELFKSFSLVEEGAMNSIWLRPLRKYTPTTVMYFAPEDEEKIVNTLENFLPEEARGLDTIDRMTRRMRF